MGKDQCNYCLCNNNNNKFRTFVGQVAIFASQIDKTNPSLIVYERPRKLYVRLQNRLILIRKSVDEAKTAEINLPLVARNFMSSLVASETGYPNHIRWLDSPSG